MKHTTQELYGITPGELKELTYEEALHACKAGTKTQLRELMQFGFMERNEPLILAINKASHWSESKLEELDGLRYNRFVLFITHIKLAFKALFRRSK